jgi:ParB family transcriptional regulator, chromosome partitioning protein
MQTVTEAPKRRALGKGLESLLPRVNAAAESGAESGESGRPREIPVGEIERSPFQTRTRFDEVQLAELAASISATGVVQPILVRPLPHGHYQLIAGERRWLASQRAGKETIPAIIRQVSDEQAMEMTIVENLQRTDLNPMEQARAYDKLSREFQLTQEQMAKRTGKDRASVANFLRLLKLPEDVQTKVEEGVLTFGHARALLPLEDPQAILKAAQKVAAQAMSVRQTEGYVQKILNPQGKKKDAGEEKANLVDPNVREVQDSLQRALGLKVRIEDRKGRGRVIIEYSQLEEFDRLLDRLRR